MDKQINLIKKINNLILNIDKIELLNVVCYEVSYELGVKLCINKGSTEYFNNVFDNESILIFEKVIIPKHDVKLQIYSADSYIDEITLEFIQTVLTLLVLNKIDLVSKRNIEQEKDVKNVLDKLSFTELSAIVNIFKDFDTNEQVIVASKVAQKNNLTRSSIVNALRKLESAMMIETYSMGVKGTHIKVLNNSFLKEIKKLI